MRKTKFANDCYYHIYNRGVDKRPIFYDKDDLLRFFQSMDEFNSLDPIGSLYENSFHKREVDSLGGSAAKLVEFVAFCLNPNHFHLILKQVSDSGVSKLMHRLGGGYTWHYNKKYDRSGSLFQGKFKAKYIDTNEYLLHLSVYVNLNDCVHGLDSLGGRAAKLVKSSWDEYAHGEKSGNGGFCEKSIILEQFNDVNEYKDFAKETLPEIRKRKDLESLLLE